MTAGLAGGRAKPLQHAGGWRGGAGKEEHRRHHQPAAPAPTPGTRLKKADPSHLKLSGVFWGAWGRLGQPHCRNGAMLGKRWLRRDPPMLPVPTRWRPETAGRRAGAALMQAVLGDFSLVRVFFFCPHSPRKCHPARQPAVRGEPGSWGWYFRSPAGRAAGVRAVCEPWVLRQGPHLQGCSGNAL